MVSGFFQKRDAFLAPIDIFQSGTSGVRWDIDTRRRFYDPHDKYLEPYGFKVYSQNDEDGIVSEIFSRIGTTNKQFIEFGVENGLECNSHYLLLKGWSGLWLEGNSDYCEDIKDKFRPAISENRLTVENIFITRDNINEVILRNGLSGEIDLLSIDVDGNDYHIWRAITVVNPRVVIIEYNAKLPPECDWCMPYNEFHIWDGSDRQGASLKALELLGRQKGYQLVATNLNGINAFFVKSELAHDKFPLPATAENLYNPMRFHNLKYRSGHPSKFFLGSAKEGMASVFEYLPDDQIFLAGCNFWPKEENGNGLFSVRWMKDNCAQVFIRCIQVGCVQIILHYQVLPAHNNIKARLDSDSWIEQTISGEQTYERLEFPPKLVESGQILLLELIVESFTTADSLLHNGDFRKLGIGLNRIDVEMMEHHEDIY